MHGHHCPFHTLGAKVVTHYLFHGWCPQKTTQGSKEIHANHPCQPVLHLGESVQHQYQIISELIFDQGHPLLKHPSHKCHQQGELIGCTPLPGRLRQIGEIQGIQMTMLRFCK